MLLCAGALVGTIVLSGCASADDAARVSSASPSLAAAPIPGVGVDGESASNDVDQNKSVVQAAGPTTASIVASGRPDSAEIDYARATAAGIFRRRLSQRSTGFVAVEGPGYGLCLRSPARSGKGFDHALIVFSQRLSGEPLSQVDDDTIVYRRAADAAPCRAGSIDWTPLVG